MHAIRNLKSIIIAGVAATLIAICMPAASAATAQSSATAQIIGGISVIKIADLVYGDVIADAIGGTVLVTPANIRSANGVAVITSSFFSPASFLVVGHKNDHYSVGMPTSITITDGAGHSMLVDTFTSIPAVNSKGKLDKDYPQDRMGADTVYVGATLHVNPNQATGIYNGIFSITISYQ